MAEDLTHIQVNSTKAALEDFKESVIWSDFVRELSAWKEGFNREMSAIVDDAATENPSTASVLLHLGDLNGRQKAIDYVLGLPDVFIQFLEDKNKTSTDQE